MLRILMCNINMLQNYIVNMENNMEFVFFGANRLPQM